MTKTALISFSRLLILLLIWTLVLSISASAEPVSPVVSSGQLGEIYSGSIPSGDGIVSVKAISGKLYQIPAMTPLGVVQALAGTDSIESYQIGDELILKKGILTLDGINNISSAGDTCWFVLVNNRQLQDYLLPTQDALNTYPLKNGDIILYAFGNPTRPLSEATATMKVSVGAQSASESLITTPINASPVSAPTSMPTVIPTPISTSPLTPVPTPTPVPQNTALPVPVVTTPTPEPMQTIVSVETTDPNKPIKEDLVDTGEKVLKSSSSDTKDPNQPVFEDEESADEDSIQDNSITNTKDPNQPVFEDEESEDEQSETTTVKAKTDSETSVVNEDNVEEEETSKPTETVTPTETPSSKSSVSGQNILYEGTMSLPSGNVNVTADSGMDYDISANTPLGLLQMLFTDGKIGTLSISDRGMNKAGILSLTGIDDYQYGDETWFVQINDNTLKDYLNPGTDGFNIKTVGSGDQVTYYYGKQDQVAKTAKAVIYITLQ